MKRGSTIIIVLFFVLLETSLASASDEILLKSRHFIPREGISQTAREKIESIPRRAHVILQLDKTPTIKDRLILERKGVKLLSYIPNKAWFASIPTANISEVIALSNVRAIVDIIC